MADSAFLQRFLMPWTVIVANTVGVTNQGYVTNAAGTTTVDLPAAAGVSDIFAVGTIQGDFQLVVDAGQNVLLNSGVSSAAGTITSNAVGDNLMLVCVVANTTWMEISVGGIMTAV